eukprot:SAG31_NODE_5182_length_2694_cov_25.840848_1_plen_332_part_00
MLYAADWKRSGTAGVLSTDIQQKGVDVLTELKHEATLLGAEQYSGIATEVFRKASNGADYLAQVRAKLGIPVVVVAQEAEARLGWLTAVAGGRAPAHTVIAWDSGGGSFQITARPKTETGSDELLLYMGSWGSTVAAEQLTTAIRGQDFSTFATANPVRLTEARALVDHCKSTLPTAPGWLASLLGCSGEDTATVVGIGGETSLFCILSEVAGLLPPQSDPFSNPTNEAKATGVDLTPAVVWEAIEATTGKSDGELQQFLQANILVPKLCLALAVMEQLGIRHVGYQPACGSCGGLLVHDSYYSSCEDGSQGYWPASPDMASSDARSSTSL